jgi:serine/threonine protein kinase
MSNDPNPERNQNSPAVTRAFSLDTTRDSQPGSASENAEELDFDVSVEVSAKNKGTKTKNPIFGEYVILDRIGAGGMGQVYRARHRTMDREVAVKILPRRLSQDPFAVERFYSEVRAQARLMHPNIVTAFDAGCHTAGRHQVHYLVMELIHGESLASRIASQGPMSTAEVLAILKQASAALEYAHSMGIVHRDIKPGNMMLTHAGVLKILDFGLAVLRDMQNTSESGTNQLMGTVEFMSPEQINTPELVDHRSDLYSLGATIFYLLTGRPMFTGEAVQTALAQVNRKPPALYEVRSDIDLRLDSVFQSLVAKDVADRCQSAHELLDKLYSLNLIEKITPPVSTRKGNGLPGISLERPTSLGRGTSTSLRSFAPIGIELGMLYSRVSYINSEFKVEEIPIDGESLELRNMLYSDHERVSIGSAAVEQRIQHPDQIFYGLQRWYGLPLLERPFGGRRVPPEVLVASVIRQLAVSARRKQPNASHAVVTIPGCYDQMHRISTKAACEIAGVEVLQLLDKPLAAALAHVEIESRLAQARGDQAYQRNMLVVMIGGSACEAAVIRADTMRTQTLSLVGDWKRGMLRWHDRATKRLAGLIEKQYGFSARDNLSLASQLQRTMERAIEKLQQTPIVPFAVDLPKGRFESALRRDSIQQWVEDLAGDCTIYANEAIKRSGIDPHEIDTVLMIGDVRWLTNIQDQLKGLVKPGANLVPMGSADLARGAAIQARLLMPPIDPKAPSAHGATTYDLGIVIQEENGPTPPKILIPKDTPFGYQVSKTLRFTREGRPQPTLQFIEGTRLGASTWNRLSQVDLQSCFEGRTTADPLQLRIEVDESGVWTGTVTWLAGNKQWVAPPLGEAVMDPVSKRQWRDWLESIMLCNMEMS